MSDSNMHPSDTTSPGPSDNATTTTTTTTTSSTHQQPLMNAKKRKHESMSAAAAAAAAAVVCASSSSSSTTSSIINTSSLPPPTIIISNDIHPIMSICSSMNEIDTRSENDKQQCISVNNVNVMHHQLRDVDEEESELAATAAAAAVERHTKTRRTQEQEEAGAGATPRVDTGAHMMMEDEKLEYRTTALSAAAVLPSMDDEMSIDLRIEEELYDRRWHRYYNNNNVMSSQKPTSTEPTLLLKFSSGSVGGQQFYRDIIISITQFLTFNQLATTMRINRQWHHAVITQPIRRMHVSINTDHTYRLCRSPALTRHISSIELIEAPVAQVYIKLTGNNQPDWYEVEHEAWVSGIGRHVHISEALDQLVDTHVHLPHLDRLAISMPLHHEDSVRQFVFPSRLRELEVDFRARSNAYNYGDHSVWPHIATFIHDIVDSLSITLSSVTIRTNHYSVSSLETGPPNDLLEPLTKCPHLTSLRFINNRRYRLYGVEWNRDHMRTIHRLYALRQLRLNIAPFIYRSDSLSNSSHLMLLIDPERTQLQQPFLQLFDAPVQSIRDENKPLPRVLLLETMEDIERYKLSEIHMQHVFAHLPQLTQLRPKSVEMRSIEGLTQLKNLIDVRLHFVSTNSFSFSREPLSTLSRMTQLRRLDLHHPLLSDSDLTHLLASLTQLESLTLSGRCQLRTLNAFSSPRVLPHVSQRLHQLELIQLEALDANSLIHLYGLQQLRRLEIIECFSQNNFLAAEKLFAPLGRSPATSPSISLPSSSSPTSSHIFTSSCGSSYSFPQLTSSQLEYASPPDPDACGCDGGSFACGCWGGPFWREEDLVTPPLVNPTADEFDAYEAESYLDQEFEFVQENYAQ